MPKVLKINNENKFEELVNKFDNNVLLPVNDGDGNLILPIEVLQNPVFSTMWDLIVQSTTEIDYIPFPEDETELNDRLQQLEQSNKLIKVDFLNEEIEHKGKKVKFKKISQNIAARIASIEEKVETVSTLTEPLPTEVVVEPGIISKIVKNVKKFFSSIFN